ncbi:MAG: DUF692 domain-containing protein [Candidatus Obscuribacterales bacterium]|nr:DUF692 domain-containing protein [Cyanobacteria bacterium SZAS LIN-5]RTL44711.1 MAG: DUF692 domain-containing protein [Candidatus Melainabacteria bacterium]
MTNQFLAAKKQLPNLGIGLGLRRELANETFDNANKIDWLELVPENYMGLGGAARQRLEKVASRFPLVSHGVNLSLGSTDELNPDYLAALKKLVDRIDAPWFSDHLCFTSVDGVYLHDLLPLPFSKEAVKHCASRARQVQHTLNRPFLIENISAYMHMPGGEMTEAQFLSSVLEEADCGMLLDVNNVYVNSQNHKFDPFEFLKQIPLERTVQIHVAGHSTGEGTIIDTHGSAIIEPVFQLLKFVLERTDVKAVMIERDQNFPQFSELLDELARIRAIANEVQPTLASVSRAHLSFDQSAPIIESSKGRENVGAALTA